LPREKNPKNPRRRGGGAFYFLDLKFFQPAVSICKKF